ncbi:hypothetical protein BKA69DRAFT_255150 [Paraphysoderma sedebokerense]|nr:hypothetical protein BKA69DRAFT_254637 [Paraphysoderma sedebokerense]KAI9142495.1 hypothetical protein BKA69DRAFT_255150 [Paraphysoderma sedebokerense]
MLYIFFPLTFSIVICLTSNTSHYKPGQTFWTDFLNGVPNQNEMGFGLFQIAGKIRTKQFIYPWRSLNPSDVGRALAWIFYGIHQLLTWLIIYLAVRAKEQKHITWTNYRNSYSNAMMIVHLTFATLKFVHSRLFYDGLAYDLPEILTQCSVLVFLIIALIVDMPRRGLFFGKVKSMEWYKQEFKEVAKKYHGFAASFGVVINFWYHPVETTLAHFLGFFYQLLMMVHTSLLFHVDHRNRYWTLFLEVNVLIHGFTTGLIQENSAYLVFLYGFATVFFVTQIWGIPSTRWQSFLTQKKKITKEYIALIVGVLVAYLAFAITNFALEKKIQRLFLLLAIPVAEYGLVLLYYLLFLIGFFVFKKIADTKGWISTAWAWFWGALSTFVVMVVFAIIQKPQGTFEI